MTPLGGALRAKFQTPQDAMRALGLDPALLYQSYPTKEHKEMPQMVRRTAMDRAISAAEYRARASINRSLSDLREAEREVEPIVGQVIGDSAEAVYSRALQLRGVDTRGIHQLSSLKALWRVARFGNAKIAAMDEASAKAYAERFPHANRLKL